MNLEAYFESFNVAHANYVRSDCSQYYWPFWCMFKKCDGLMCFHKCSFYLHTELIEKGIEINKDGVAAMGTVAEFKCLEQIASSVFS